MKNMFRFMVSIIAGILSLVCVSNAQAFRKPVEGLRDYNGTYLGTSATGSVGYTTLYRDNYDQGRVSGCNGEGCGSHPGVDIPVGSGTRVFAALSGTLRVTWDCTAKGWGGLAILEAKNPFNPNEIIYVSYAHLRKITHPAGPISEGAVIGESGGGRGDYCPGNSTNPHLHFQIDKNHGLKKPYFPNRDINQPDSDFLTTGYTYNPAMLISGGYNWSFDQTGFAENWLPRNVSQWGVNSGLLWIDGNADPGIARSEPVSCGRSFPCTGSISAEADLYKTITISLQNFCISNPVKIYFTTSLDSAWSESKSVSFNYSFPATYVVNMSRNPNWRGIITRVRIDPAVNCNPNATDPNYFYRIAIQR